MIICHHRFLLLLLSKENSILGHLSVCLSVALEVLLKNWDSRVTWYNLIKITCQQSDTFFCFSVEWTTPERFLTSHERDYKLILELENFTSCIIISESCPCSTFVPKSHHFDSSSTLLMITAQNRIQSPHKSRF